MPEVDCHIKWGSGFKSWTYKYRKSYANGKEEENKCIYGDSAENFVKPDYIDIHCVLCRKIPCKIFPGYAKQSVIKIYIFHENTFYLT